MKVALIEFEDSHDECLYTQVVFLSKAGHSVVLCCSEKVYERVKYFDGVEKFICNDFQSLHFISGKNSYLNFVRQLKALNISHIIFNSASGKKVLKFLLLSRFCKFSYAGLLHNVDKLEKSTIQKLISLEIKKYFVLNNYVSIPKHKHKIQCCGFYPIIFPVVNKAVINKEENEIWLCIPGQVEFKRRDYKGFFDMLARYPLPQNIKLIFLGKCMHTEGNGEEIKQLISKLSIEKQCILFDNFVPLDVFYAYLTLSDYVLPLTHPEKLETTGYGTYKVSGTFNLAFGFRKIMFCDKYYATFEDFSDSCIFYNPDNMETIFETIESGKIDKANYYKSDFWNTEKQQQKFLRFVFEK